MFDSPITSVKRETFIRTTPERVWKALTNPAERNRWETRQANIDLRIDGKVELDYGWGVDYVGTIVEIEENARLVIKDESDDLTIWTLRAVEEGTVVELEYTGLWAGALGFMTAEDMGFGTEQLLRNMVTVLEEEQDNRGTYWTSWIGVNHHTLLNSSQKGSVIVKVIPDTPAEGILLEGDIILRVNDLIVETFSDFERIVTMTVPGQTLTVGILRGDEEQQFTLHTVPFGEKKVAS
ncbi:SRPBCC domain-containing protein [Paenibacillus arenosi]|uniref:SRPBCC domain-containing protein n=1 Tax=Paenibacillus arenosi TaxID=2774142 RepID=A0ABR9AXA4_9BACL|nr:SRPBCC domain-containing protein [Paenibacillus arenosi]MBD8498766.1 SRPBCC domain-containing protein [Paenibacillus arenosi]